MQENNTSTNGNEKQVMDGNEEHTNEENRLLFTDLNEPFSSD